MIVPDSRGLLAEFILQKESLDSNSELAESHQRWSEVADRGPFR